jgi:hypothetical protein
MAAQVPQAAGTLTSNIYAAQSYTKQIVRMLEEGRTKIRMHGVMHKLLVPDEDVNLDAIHVLITEVITKDFKNLDSGFSTATQASRHVTVRHMPVHDNTCVAGRGQPTTLDSRMLRPCRRQSDPRQSDRHGNYGCIKMLLLCATYSQSRRSNLGNDPSMATS